MDKIFVFFIFVRRNSHKVGEFRRWFLTLTMTFLFRRHAYSSLQHPDGPVRPGGPLLRYRRRNSPQPPSTRRLRPRHQRNRTKTPGQPASTKDLGAHGATGEQHTGTTHRFLLHHCNSSLNNNLLFRNCTWVSYSTFKPHCSELQCNGFFKNRLHTEQNTPQRIPRMYHQTRHPAP